MNTAHTSPEPEIIPPGQSVPVGASFPWKRLLLSIAFGFAAAFALWLFIFAAIMQFILRAVDGAPSERLSRFGKRTGAYLRDIAAYMTFAREEEPWPFADFPKE